MQSPFSLFRLLSPCCESASGIFDKSLNRCKCFRYELSNVLSAQIAHFEIQSKIASDLFISRNLRFSGQICIKYLAFVIFNVPFDIAVVTLGRTLPKALRTQALTALTSNFGLVGLVHYAW